MSKTILVTVLLIVAQFSTIIRDWITRTTEFHLERSDHDISDCGETKNSSRHHFKYISQKDKTRFENLAPKCFSRSLMFDSNKI